MITANSASKSSVDAFLKFKGGIAPEIKGEASDSKHPDEIEVQSFEWQIDNTLTFGSSSGGAGAGKVSFRTLKILKSVDRATPLLYSACCLGLHYEEMQLSVRKAGGVALDYLVIRARMVGIASIKYLGMVDGTSPIPMEEVSLTCGSVQFEYTPQTKSGSGSSPVIAAYNAVYNNTRF